MNVEILSVGPFEVNCAIVWNNGKQTLVMDPGYDAAQIETLLRTNGLTVVAYLLTHGHADHLCALADLCKTRPAPVYIHAQDAAWAFGPHNEIPPCYPVPKKPSVEWIHPEGSKGRSIADFRLQPLETPGHTPGGMCYYFEQEKIIFTGDTLFKGSCGRTDLPGGDGRALAQSLQKLAALPDEVAVYPGHNEPTTIGREKRANVFMKQSGW